MACADCGKTPAHGVALLGMHPGKGSAWWLCGRCWSESTRRGEPRKGTGR